MENHHFWWVNPLFLCAIFNSKLLVYQRVTNKGRFLKYPIPWWYHTSKLPWLPWHPDCEPQVIAGTHGWFIPLKLIIIVFHPFISYVYIYISYNNGPRSSPSCFRVSRRAFFICVQFKSSKIGKIPRGTSQTFPDLPRPSQTFPACHGSALRASRASHTSTPPATASASARPARSSASSRSSWRRGAQSRAGRLAK